MRVIGCALQQRIETGRQSGGQQSGHPGVDQLPCPFTLFDHESMQGGRSGDQDALLIEEALGLGSQSGQMLHTRGFAQDELPEGILFRRPKRDPQKGTCDMTR